MTNDTMMSGLGDSESGNVENRNVRSRQIIIGDKLIMQKIMEMTICRANMRRICAANMRKMRKKIDGCCPMEDSN